MKIYCVCFFGRFSRAQNYIYNILPIFFVTTYMHRQFYIIYHNIQYTYVVYFILQTNIIITVFFCNLFSYVKSKNLGTPSHLSLIRQFSKSGKFKF